MATNVPLCPYVAAALTANGGANGTLTVADTSSFRLGATVWLADTVGNNKELIVAAIVSATVIAVRDANANRFDYWPAGLFTTAHTATVYQNIQPDFLASNWS